MKTDIEVQRDYWNNEADAFERIYSREKSRLSSWLDQIFRKDMYERFIFTLKNCEPIKKRTFLDVGCGNGLYSIELAKKGAAKVIGLDISPVMIERCERSVRKEALDDCVSFFQTDLLDYEPHGKFDVSFGIGLFDYIKHSLPVVKKMKEVSSDKVIMAFPRFWTWRAPLRKIRLTIRGCPVFFYSKNKVNHLMKEAGFSRWDVTRVGKLHCVIAFVPNPDQH